jgi:hypothetical protein
MDSYHGIGEYRQVQILGGFGSALDSLRVNCQNKGIMETARM